MRMLAPIAFVSKISEDAQKAWVKALQAVMPDEKIVLYNDIADRSLVDIAVVANPEVTELIHLPNLKWIQSLWSGVDQLIGLQALSNIPIVRMVDPQMSKIMAEAVLAWVLYLHRGMPTYAKQQQEKLWQQIPYIRAENRTIGLLGLGELGFAASEVLSNVGFKVLGWSRNEKEFENIETYIGTEGLTKILAKSDIIVCLLPLTLETRNLLNHATLPKMKRGSSLINFGRGELVRIDDLLDVLDKGHLSHAVLDVFNVEPLPEKSEIWEHPKITVLPHISAPSDMETSAKIVAQHIQNYRKHGAIPVSVNKAKGY